VIPALSSNMWLVVMAVVALLLYLLFRQRFQRCPHSASAFSGARTAGRS